MEIINNSLLLISHMSFIFMSYQLLTHLVDWSKWVKVRPDNLGQLRLFVLFISIALGYLISHFVLEIIQISQTLFISLSV